ncbi:hypothetical protein DACRYDRAFT_117213 [Dacryopinax primogenitus]|uniref:Uncharacterized protein n=1 Tax=Dacryopinax primogenitus (strain DJM 731) TaxID=1858805 RepID=M5FWP8_DACPD|nr:uncharacterized protein DACRYDRAFT_117213 [Dacryopinax primogenitus]EJU00819.1 hypothetical protein DACRYDRAFT_117213 [Dacryopinax primogenitus]
MSNGTPSSTSLKITIKRPPSAPSNPPPAGNSPAPASDKKRKRVAEDDGAENGDTPPVKRSTRDGETRRAKRQSARIQWTPSPPGEDIEEQITSKGKRRRKAYEEDGDYDPDRLSPAGSAVLDVEGGVDEEPPRKKPAIDPPVSSTPSGRSKRKSKPTAKVPTWIDDDEDDLTPPPPTPPPRNPKPAKGRGRTSNAAPITARDQRKLPVGNVSQGETAVDAVSGTNTTDAIAPVPPTAPADPPKPKLPPIKKKSMMGGTPTTNGASLPGRDETKTPVSTTKANDMYNQLFSGTSSRAQKDRERQDARRQELEGMRTDARIERELEAKNTFDMLAHSAAMNRFESRLRDRRNWPSPSQIGSAFLMLKRYRPDLPDTTKT